MLVSEKFLTRQSSAIVKFTVSENSQQCTFTRVDIANHGYPHLLKVVIFWLLANEIFVNVECRRVESFAAKQCAISADRIGNFGYIFITNFEIISSEASLVVLYRADCDDKLIVALEL